MQAKYIMKEKLNNKLWE